MALKRLGQILTDLGLIDDEQLEQMLAEQEARGGELLGRVGLSLDFYSDEQLGEALAEQWNTLFVTLYDKQISHNLIEIISRTMAEMYRVVPLELKDNRLTIATADPQKIQIADELRVFLGYDIHVVVATDGEIDKAIEKFYSGEIETVETIVEEMEADKDLANAAKEIGNDGPIDLTSAEAMADSAPVRKLLNLVLLMAIKENASDIQDIQSLREVDISAIQPAAKRLLLDLRSLNIPLDNIDFVLSSKSASN